MTKPEKKGKLYLVPAPLGNEPVSHILPPRHVDIIRSLDLFFVENIRSARRYLRKIDPAADIDSMEFVILDKHTEERSLLPYLAVIEKGRNAAILSEAGLPCIADPGAIMVRLAHETGIKPVPLPGPSSILQGLMASGMTGQQFTFHGYLPIQKRQRAEAIRDLDRRAGSEGATHIFMETPYRNLEMFGSVIQHCRKDTYLCIACQIMQDDEWIVTRRIGDWHTEPDIHKKPAIFLLYRDDGR